MDSAPQHTDPSRASTQQPFGDAHLPQRPSAPEETEMVRLTPRDLFRTVREIREAPLHVSARVNIGWGETECTAVFRRMSHDGTVAVELRHKNTFFGVDRKQLGIIMQIDPVEVKIVEHHRLAKVHSIQFFRKPAKQPGASARQ